jgi:hypothetical protein
VKKAFSLNVFLFGLPLAFLKFVLNIAKVSDFHNGAKLADIILHADTYHPMMKTCYPAIFAGPPNPLPAVSLASYWQS